MTVWLGVVWTSRLLSCDDSSSLVDETPREGIYVTAELLLEDLSSGR